MRKILIGIGLALLMGFVLDMLRRRRPKTAEPAPADVTSEQWSSSYPERIELFDVMNWVGSMRARLADCPALCPAVITMEEKNVPMSFRRPDVTQYLLMTVVDTASSQVAAGYAAMTHLCASGQVAPQIASMFDENPVVIFQTREADK